MNVFRSYLRIAWACSALLAWQAGADPDPTPAPAAPTSPTGVVQSSTIVSSQPKAPARPAPVLAPRPATPVIAANALAPGASGKPDVLVFDATNKQVEVSPGENMASFVFAVTNVSPDEVTISYVNTSCGCTAGKLPSYPWKLKSGEGGHIDVTMDLKGKIGVVTKTATVVSSAGSYPLLVTSKIPQNAPGVGGDRSRNMQVAAADRQAVFRNDCASCHVQPTLGKSGKDLYDTACAICHEAEHRATMVPDLRLRLANTDRNYWTKWISEGRVGSLMPAFAAKQGGILSDEQIDSLVAYLEDVYKKNPPPSKTVATPAPASVPAASTDGKPPTQ